MEQEKRQNLQLESEVFSNEQEKKKLSDWVWMNTNFEVKYIDRKDLNKNHSDTILEKNGKDFKEIIWYNLYLPHDLKIKEIPKVVEQINTLTFWNNIPDYASLKEIEKYIREYKTHFPQCEFKYFTEFENKINKTEIGKCEAGSQYIKSIQKQEGEDPDENLDEIENELALKLNDQLKQSITELGMKNIANYMPVFDEKFLTWLSIEQRRKIDFEWKNIYRNQLKLREVIGIDNLKIQLENAKKTNDTTKIEKVEKEILWKIIQEIHKYPYYEIEVIWGEPNNLDPISIIEDKQIMCVSKVIISSSFFRELWINHTIADVPLHSAIVVKTASNKKYYFDPTIPFNIDLSKTKKIWEYNLVSVVSKDWKLDTVIRYKEQPDIEKFTRFLILSSIERRTYYEWKKYIEKGEIKKGFQYIDKAIEWYKSLIREWFRSSSTYNNLWVFLHTKWQALEDIWKTKEAIKYYNSSLEHQEESLKIDPVNQDTYLKLSDTTVSLLKAHTKNFTIPNENMLIKYWETFNKYIDGVFKYNYKKMLEYEMVWSFLKPKHMINAIIINYKLWDSYTKIYKKTNNTDNLSKSIYYYEWSIEDYELMKKQFKNIENSNDVNAYVLKVKHKRDQQLKYLKK